MEAEALKQRLDDLGIGDPAAVDRLEEIIPEFGEQLAELDEDTAVHLVAIASLFHDEIDAFEVLRGCRWLQERPGGLARFYQEQLRVWRSRKDKSQHDAEYLRILLGIKAGGSSDRRAPPGGGGSGGGRGSRTSPGA
jgi:hypothetical protein